MPLYQIHVWSDDRAINSPDPEGLTLENVGLARARAVETLIEFARARPPLGKGRTITVSVRDEAETEVYRDAVTVRGVCADDAAVGRAIGAMQRNA